MCQCDNGAKFAPLINAYVIIFIYIRTSCLGSESAVCTPSEENAEPTGDPFLAALPLSPAARCSLPIMVKWEPGANGTGENERGAKVLNISLSCCEL